MVDASWTDLVIFKSADVWVEYKPSVLPSFHDISVLVEQTFQWLPAHIQYLQFTDIHTDST